MATDLEHAFGEDEADDLVRVHHTDRDLVTLGAFALGGVSVAFGGFLSSCQLAGQSALEMFPWLTAGTVTGGLCGGTRVM